MGSSKSEREVYDYLLSIDYAFGHGPVHSVNQIRVKEKPIFGGKAQARKNVKVARPDLFGGDDKEGGCVGTVEVYMGTDGQRASEALAARHGRTPATTPGYRGIAHLFFRGAGGNGFRWSSNNPYLPPVDAHITRKSTTLNDTTALV